MASRTRPALTAITLATALAVAGCTAADDSDADGGGGGSDTLVIDTSFIIETGDPGRTYDQTGYMVVKAVYETLLTFEPGDETTPVPGLASYEQNEDATEFTFTLDGERTFSDGSVIDADDVVFSLERVGGMVEISRAGFLMNDIDVEKVDEFTVRISTERPSLQLPALMANPSLAIVNSAEVIDNGGTTDGEDDAQTFLDNNSAGSGPYELDSFDLTSQVVLTRNENYNGPADVDFDRVVIRNVSESATQLINLQGGDSHVAVDLSGDQVADLGEDFTVNSGASAQTIFLLINQNPDVGDVTANPEFAEAVRYALDYDALLELAGAGAEQATGVIPPSFLGALTEGVEQDLDRSESALEASDYDGESITLQYPNDFPVGGVAFTPLAERIQDQLEAAGISVDLAPAPFATEIELYAGGEEAFGMWFWGPDYADSANFLPFGPGQTVGLRSGWTEDMSAEVADLAEAALLETDVEAREGRFTEFATAMQEQGPFVPLIVPGSNIATAAQITGVVYNSTWTMDIAEISSAN